MYPVRPTPPQRDDAGPISAVYPVFREASCVEAKRAPPAESDDASAGALGRVVDALAIAVGAHPTRVTAREAYFEAVLLDAPHLAARVGLLRDAHGHLMRSIAAACRRSHVPFSSRALVRLIRPILRQFRAHEQAECALLSDCCLVDFGGEG